VKSVCWGREGRAGRMTLPRTPTDTHIVSSFATLSRATTHLVVVSTPGIPR
jgi:hypothetical protein